MNDNDKTMWVEFFFDVTTNGVSATFQEHFSFRDPWQLSGYVDKINVGGGEGTAVAVIGDKSWTISTNKIRTTAGEAKKLWNKMRAFGFERCDHVEEVVA
jgi:hypothetical protein